MARGIGRPPSLLSKDISAKQQAILDGTASMEEVEEALAEEDEQADEEALHEGEWVDGEARYSGR